MRWKSYMYLLVMFLGASSLIACGGVPRPERQFTQTSSTLSAAEAIGAERTPQAALHLKMARDALSEAERLMAQENYERATLVLDRAEADAELALSLAQETQVRNEAEDAIEKLKRLRQAAEK